MRLAIVGSRDFPNLHLVTDYLDGQRGDIECIVSGGARGVDLHAEVWARGVGLPVVSFRPVKMGQVWKVDRVELHGEGFVDHHILQLTYRSFPAAAFVRNGFIIEFADAVTAFLHNSSKGTSDSIRKAREMGNLKDIIHG